MKGEKLNVTKRISQKAAKEAKNFPKQGLLPCFAPFASFCSKWSFVLSTVGAGKNHSVNAISQFNFVEVDQQAKRHIEQFHVAKQLRLMNRQNFLHGLKFQQQAFFNKNIQAQGFLKNHSFVFNFHVTLGNARNAPQIEFTHQTFFINAFDQTRPPSSDELRWPRR